MSQKASEHLNLNSLLITALGVMVWSMAQEEHSDLKLTREHQIVNEARISVLETNAESINRKLDLVVTKDQMSDLKWDLYEAFGPFDGMGRNIPNEKVGHNPLDMPPHPK